MQGFQGFFGGQAPQGFQDPPCQELQDGLPDLLPGVLPDEFMQRERRARDTDWDDPNNRKKIDKAVIRLFRDKYEGRHWLTPEQIQSEITYDPHPSMATISRYLWDEKFNHKILWGNSRTR